MSQFPNPFKTDRCVKALHNPHCLTQKAYLSLGVKSLIETNTLDVRTKEVQLWTEMPHF